MTYVLANPNYQLAQKIANNYGGTLENVAGDGWVIRIQKNNPKNNEFRRWENQLLETFNRE